MKKQLLSTAFSSLLCFSVHADSVQPPASIDSPPPSNAQNTQETTVATPPISSLAAAPHALPPIDCEYAIPATTKAIDQSILSTWADKAAVQIFSFTPESVDVQLDKLKTCFTDQGWKGYHDALNKSGNIVSIKTHRLNVSSEVSGKTTINAIQENQWKISLPMTVVYQNDKEKLTQELAVDLLIGRQASGNLGIMQVIASPKEDTTVTASTTQP